MADESTYFNELSNLRENESLFFALSELSPAGIFLTDKNGDCLYVNQKWQEMSGLSLKEALGKGWKSALHQDDLEKIFSKWYKVVETQGNWKFEYRFVNPESKIFKWLLGTAKPLYDGNGVLKGYLGLNIDITEEKLKDEEIKNSMKEELQDARSQLNKLQGILPICASCKKIRDQNDSWMDADEYFNKNTNVGLSHGVCPDCLKLLYPNVYNKKYG